jgi:hypothetical protein
MGVVLIHSVRSLKEGNGKGTNRPGGDAELPPGGTSGTRAGPLSPFPLRPRAGPVGRWRAGLTHPGAGVTRGPDSSQETMDSTRFAAAWSQSPSPA